MVINVVFFPPTPTFRSIYVSESANKCPLGGGQFKLKVSRRHYLNLIEGTYKNRMMLYGIRK